MKTMAIVHPDKRGRIHLTKFGVKPGDRYEIQKHEDGRVILTPVKEEKE